MVYPVRKPHAMNWKARSYATVVTVLGWIVVGELFAYWHSDNLLRFGIFTALAVLTSRWRLALPGARASMSANFLFVLVAAVQLSESETLLLAVLAVVAHTWPASRGHWRRRMEKVAFFSASMAIAVRVTAVTFYDILPAFPAVEGPMRLAIAACMYFQFSTAPISTMEALRKNQPLLRTWARNSLWALPYHLTGAAISGVLWAVRSALDWQAVALAAPAMYLFYRWYTGYLEGQSRERTEAREMAALHLRTIESLALAIEARDQAGHDHFDRVQLFCTEIGREMGLGGAELQALVTASLLHDIGKLAVPEHISAKPGPLTTAEFDKIKIHPVVGARILERVQFPYPVVPIVRHHHEKWDGTGYPDGIRGGEIPLGARILGAVDCLDALTTDRPYRRAMTLDDAVKVLKRESGRSFDPDVVDVIEKQYRELEEKAVRLHSEREGATHGAEEERAYVESIAAAREEGQFLFTIFQDMTLSLEVNTLFERLSSRLREMVPFDAFVYYHLEGDTLCPLFASGLDDARFTRLRVPVGQGLSGWAVRERQPVLNGNPAAELHVAGEKAGTTALRSALVIPIEGATGIGGAVMLCAQGRDSYTENHLRILAEIGARLGYPVEHALQYQKASGDAFTDSLTGLPNSRWMAGRLEDVCREAMAGNAAFVVLMMDLDGFKWLNDSFGHLKGDEALREVASSVRALMPESSVLARVGGDEFDAIFRGFDLERAAALAERIQQETEDAGARVAGNGRLSCSWGLAVYGHDGESPQTLLAEADRRMYIYKQTKQERMASRLARLARCVEQERVSIAETLDRS